MLIKCCVLVFVIVGVKGGIVLPNDLTSALDLAWAFIPQIKTGTDNRIGFGYSLGNHADMQIVFELGPQIATNPIGSPYSSGSKRHAQEQSSIQRQKNLERTKRRKYLRKVIKSDTKRIVIQWNRNNSTTDTTKSSSLNEN